jgi:ribosome production factor 1
MDGANSSAAAAAPGSAGAGGPPKRVRIRPAEIGNKIKRSEVYHKQRLEKKKDKAESRRKRQRERDELGESAPPKQQPRTLDNTREVDDTIVAPGDEEVLRDEEEDEFAPYFSGARTPKLMVTTKVRPSSKIFELISELLNVLPNR